MTHVHVPRGVGEHLEHVPLVPGPGVLGSGMEALGLPDRDPALFEALRVVAIGHGRYTLSQLTRRAAPAPNAARPGAPPAPGET